jgi:hypothetical protein
MNRVPRWRNGRRGGLKIRFLQGSVGSSPSLGSKPTPEKFKNQRPIIAFQ